MLRQCNAAGACAEIAADNKRASMTRSFPFRHREPVKRHVTLSLSKGMSP
jgi:hypothetical protein